MRRKIPKLEEFIWCSELTGRRRRWSSSSRYSNFTCFQMCSIISKLCFQLVF